MKEKEDERNYMKKEKEWKKERKKERKRERERGGGKKRESE